MSSLILALVGYLTLSITTARLMGLTRYERRWRAWIPYWNLLILSDMVGVQRMLWVVPVLFFPFVVILTFGLGFYLIFAILSFAVGIQLAKRTEKPIWVGFIGTLPIVQWIGWPLMAYSARDGHAFEDEGQRVATIRRTEQVDPNSPEVRLNEIERRRQIGELTSEEAGRLRRQVMDEAMGRTSNKGPA